MSSKGISTKDKQVIIALRTLGHVPEKIEAEKCEDGRSVIMMYTFGPDAMDDYEKWMRGVNEEPFGTIRKVNQALESFKNNLHRFRHSP